MQRYVKTIKTKVLPELILSSGEVQSESILFSREFTSSWSSTL